MWCAHQIINYVHCNLILAGAVPSNVIQPRKCLVQSNLIKSRMNILITSVSACPPPLLSRCQVPQFSAVSRRKSGCSEAAPNNFPPCLVCAAHKLFAFARKLFLNLRGKRHVSNMIFSILAKKWSLACGRSCACSVNNNLRYVAAALFPCWGQNVLVLSTNVFYAINKFYKIRSTNTTIYNIWQAQKTRLICLKQNETIKENQVLLRRGKSR